MKISRLETTKFVCDACRADETLNTIDEQSAIVRIEALHECLDVCQKHAVEIIRELTRLGIWVVAS